MQDVTRPVVMVDVSATITSSTTVVSRKCPAQINTSALVAPVRRVPTRRRWYKEAGMVSFTREQVINSARTYLGVKFRMYGRDRTGVDCVGLLYCVARDMGCEPENFTNYTNAPESVKLQKMLDTYTY